MPSMITSYCRRFLPSMIFPRSINNAFRIINRTHNSEETVKTPKLEEVNPIQNLEQSDALKAQILENEKLTNKINEIDDKFKRALAESENTRKRMARQIEETKIFAIQNFCKDLLDVADTLHQAVKFAPKEATDENLKIIISGVQMTEQKLQSIFRRHGLNQINPIGQKFDPNQHHAMFEVEDESKEPGIVSIVNQIGYKLHDRTIRPAMVGVIKSKTNNK